MEYHVCGDDWNSNIRSKKPSVFPAVFLLKLLKWIIIINKKNGKSFYGNRKILSQKLCNGDGEHGDFKGSNCR